ncbi:MAG: hypothetical protein EOO48_05560 [Flavobacterium sp.]|nr:MAG: hypothetical protein EOO48_05560 [Flavobacterium sp.]
MKINPKNGIDKLLFGMKRNDVAAIYGKPDKEFTDEDSNIIYLYNQQKLRLTFYEDEDFRLGYIISSNPELELFGEKLIGKSATAVKEAASAKGLRSWESEDFDMAENHFNEENWLILQSEFGEVIKVELGVVAKNMDDFDWKF